MLRVYGPLRPGAGFGKNSCITALQSGSINPVSTSTAWLRSASLRMLNFETAPPRMGSVIPQTTFLMRGEDERAGAHRAGLFGDIHDGIVEPPVADGLRCLCDGEYFRVGGGIVEGFGLVVCFSDDFVVQYDHGAAGDFAFGGGQAALHAVPCACT